MDKEKKLRGRNCAPKVVAFLLKMPAYGGRLALRLIKTRVLMQQKTIIKKQNIYKMKKLKLSLQNIEGAEVLTRAQLKNVLGGTSLPEETTTGDAIRCRSTVVPIMT